MPNSRAALLVGAACVLLSSADSACAAEFWTLPYLDPSFSGNYSYAYSISADGQLIVGECNSPTVSEHGEAVQWRKSGNTWAAAGLGLPASPAGAKNDPAMGVASDRTVTVGRMSFGPPTSPTVDTYAYCWASNASFKLLPLPPGYNLAQANATTGGGSTIVGFGSTDAGYPNARPLVWRGSYASGSWNVSLLDAAGGMANSVDGSGQRVAGWSRPTSASSGIPAGQVRQGIIWSWLGGSWHGFWLKSLAGDKDRSEALRFSSAGDIVLGYSGSHATGTRAVYWNVAPNGHPGKIHSLGTLPGYTSGLVQGVSTGKRMVGYCTRMVSGNFEYEAFVWEPAKGMASLRSLLVDAGVHDADAWISIAATGISADGKILCGYGNDPKGQDRGWAAYLP